MAVNYGLMPNESILLKEVSVAHGGVMAAYTDELILTNLNLICVGKGIFGNNKGIKKYPLHQIKIYDGKPQAMQGKLSNGTPALEVYFMNGATESFSFQSGNKKKIEQFIQGISKALGVSNNSFGYETETNDDVDDDSLIGAFKEVGEEFADVGKELLGVIGIKPGKKKNNGVATGPVHMTKKCMSCSAPLSGMQGSTIKCKYCDTIQTL